MSFPVKRALFFWKSDRKCSCTFFRGKRKSDPKSSQASRKKFETEEFDIMADLKEAVYDTIEEKGRLDHEMIAEKVFKENITAKLAFKEEVQEQGFVPEAPL